MKGGDDQTMPPEVRAEVEHKPPTERRRIEQVWGLLGHLKPGTLDVPGTDAAWDDLQSRLDATLRAKQIRGRGPVRRRRVRWSAMAVAASLVLLLGGGWLWRQPITVNAVPGAQLTVTLPEGTTVHLNSGSRLTYRRGFQAWPFVLAARRVVRLEGEAFFDVIRAERPFVVETFNARVEVLGTTFNVRARQGLWEGETRVTLASGQVRVIAPHTPTYLEMLTEAGQEAVVGKEAPSGQSQAENLDRVLVWRVQGFAVVDQPLAFILAEVERRYASSIDIEDGLALTDSLSLFYPRGTTAEQIIHDICLAQDCRYRQTSQGFAVLKADPASTR